MNTDERIINGETKASAYSHTETIMETLQKPLRNRKDELIQQAKMFHEKHPQIWGLFVEDCFEKINQGFTRFSAKGIIEQIRWKENLTNGKNKLKPGYSLSNDYTCWYARKFIESYPQHREFFELRKRSSAKRPPSSEVKVRNLDKNFNDGHSYYLFRVDE